MNLIGTVSYPSEPDDRFIRPAREKQTEACSTALKTHTERTAAAAGARTVAVGACPVAMVRRHRRDAERAEAIRGEAESRRSLCQ